LTNDLLLLTGIGLPTRSTVDTSINLSDLVMATVDQISPLADAKGISVTAESPQKTVQVSGDFDQLTRLFWNLLDNSVKYTPLGGSIAVAVGKTDQGSVCVSISNTGPGFPPEDENRVFERFYRVHEDRSRNSGGSGLGLAIALEIARAHGGTIRAVSQPGRLTTFIVDLPIEKPGGR
jgi:signal transduction histidine kinase